MKLGTNHLVGKCPSTLEKDGGKRGGGGGEGKPLSGLSKQSTDALLNSVPRSGVRGLEWPPFLVNGDGCWEGLKSESFEDQLGSVCDGPPGTLVSYFISIRDQNDYFCAVAGSRVYISTMGV
ncbi:hypothetical protein PoB_001602600 [Plakobranchus ocellatus]|uniref:Uncharacterized protein n=1 Tax=Plakobranchus ocellatus TaxID=259542 RepID=A0AAV3Z111_9GAST|nr:hypothetical protein PoB_001602600 [Plakobranchus ocellatus]